MKISVDGQEIVETRSEKLLGVVIYNTFIYGRTTCMGTLKT